MTDLRKKLWDMLPEGEWVVRDEIHKKYGKWNFQGSLSWLFKKKVIELEFVEGVQYMRRKTINEIAKIEQQRNHTRR